MAEYGKCGEEHGRFYDRRGDYFREGVDPRNYFGRHVEEHIKTSEHHQFMDGIQRQMFKLVAHQLGGSDG